MRDYFRIPGRPQPAHEPACHPFLELPATWLGRSAVLLTAVALAAILFFPQISLAHNQTYPAIPAWIMPAMLTVLVDGIAVLNILAVWRAKEHCVVSTLVLVLSVQASLFTTIMVIGEAVVP